MELNLTIEHFCSFYLMACMASHVVCGARLIRLIAWLALWQVFTPVRPICQDIPLMAVSWAALEWLYLNFAWNRTVL